MIGEEYGSPFPDNNHTATEKPWQDTILKSGIAADQIWQFGAYGTTVPPEALSDEFSIFYNDSEYKVLAVEHAAEMLAKRVPFFAE